MILSKLRKLITPIAEEIHSQWCWEDKSYPESFLLINQVKLMLKILFALRTFNMVKCCWSTIESIPSNKSRFLINGCDPYTKDYYQEKFNVDFPLGSDEMPMPKEQSSKALTYMKALLSPLIMELVMRRTHWVISIGWSQSPQRRTSSNGLIIRWTSDSMQFSTPINQRMWIGNSIT